MTVLKPLCGSDSGLSENLASFFEQDYPDFELLFGVQSPDDPAIQVVATLRRHYPGVRCSLVAHDDASATNPKVSNLCGMLPHARNDLLLISDSNVRAPRHYLRDMVRTLRADERTGLVTNVFAGSNEDGLGAALENVQLNGFCAAGATLPTRFGSAAVVGKSMLLSRRRFERLGGFQRVADLLAEDYVMGKMFQHAGYRVRIAPTVLTNVTTGMSVLDFLRRHQRWAMLRWRLLPVAFTLEPLTSPVAILPLAWLVLGSMALPWAAALLILRDVGGWVALRGWRRAWIPALLAPLRDLCVLALWLRAPVKRHVRWRGTKVRVGAGTILYAPRRTWAGPSVPGSSANAG
ncbi:MAG: glycosyltransferase [Deltaproteobacteria bacterium]|nr:glycosyltransferase [Deltaproteobacteria bacterium]MBW2531173.1 glycosyltransferase [Deltaproteobacteria bacterium]